MSIYVATQATADAWNRILAASRAYHRSGGPAKPDYDVESPLSSKFAAAVRDATPPDDREQAVSVAQYAANQSSEQLVRSRLTWDAYLSRMADEHAAAAVMRTAVGQLAKGQDELFERECIRDARLDMNRLRTALTLLAGVCADLDPYGTDSPTVLDSGTGQTGPWEPSWQQFPEWRRKLVTHYRDPSTHAYLAETLMAKSRSVGPDTDADEGGEVLAAAEAERLEKARIFYADPATMAIAVRKAMRPRSVPIAEHRVPRPYGFLVFGSPLAAAVGKAAFVAASWGSFDAGSFEGGWRYNSGSEARLQTGDGWWITLYGQSRPGEPIPVWWMTETTVRDGYLYDKPTEPGTALHAVRTVIACWDLNTQYRVGKPVTDVTEHRRKPAKVRADRRRGIKDDGTVSIISPRRHPVAPKPRDSHDPTGTGYKIDYQQPVGEHTKSHCMNPRLHTEGGCTHEDITVLDYVRGPEGAPMRMPKDVVERIRGAR